jgi:hypothetical protein
VVVVTGIGGTHHTECWAYHGDCARAEVIRLQKANAVLRHDIEVVREELAATRRQLLLVETQHLDLIRLSENRDSGPLTTTSPRETS